MLMTANNKPFFIDCIFFVMMKCMHGINFHATHYIPLNYRHLTHTISITKSGKVVQKRTLLPGIAHAYYCIEKNTIFNVSLSLKIRAMKRVALSLFVAAMVMLFACDKDDNGHSDRFNYLTTPVWASDSLLVNGQDASGEGQMLENFEGDAKFNKDGTGYFGSYTGTWAFAQNETQLLISSPDLGGQLTTNIVLLNATDLKVTTIFPNFANPEQPYQIRMTFKAK
jgi:hypothetical protein